MKKIAATLLSVIFLCCIWVAPAGVNAYDFENDDIISIDSFDQVEDSLEQWFIWLPMDTWNKKTYHDKLNEDFARTFHEMMIPFDVGMLNIDDVQSILVKNNISSELSKVFYLDEIQQTFNAAYGTNIDMYSLDGLLMDGTHVLVRIIDNYFVVILSPHGAVSNPTPRGGWRLGTSGAYWEWYYQDEWNTNDSIYTIICSKKVAGYDVGSIEYIGFEAPSDEILNSYKNDIYDNTFNIIITLNGKELYFDQPPIIKDDRTLVPMRAIFEAMGCEVEWHSDTSTIFVLKDNTKVIEMKINSNVMWTEDNPQVYIDVPPQIVNDRTLVPVRAISESIGASVTWLDDTKTVDIWYENR